VRKIYKTANLLDNGGRRLGVERRQISYSDHIPERRSGIDRRRGKDRRRCGKNVKGADERAKGDASGPPKFRRFTDRADFVTSK
jgi:hypothetical protein